MSYFLNSTVDSNYNGNVSITVDTYGNPHVVRSYANHVYYSTLSGGSWNHELIGYWGPSVAYPYACIVLNAAQNPCIAYHGTMVPSPYTSGIVFQTWNGSSWDYDVNTFTPFTDFELHLSMDIDSLGYAHMLGWNANECYYMTNKTGSWVNTNISFDYLHHNSDWVVGGYTSDGGTAIVVDANDKIHFVYRAHTSFESPRITYGTDESGSLVMTDLFTGNYYVGHDFLAVDGDRNVYMAYVDFAGRIICSKKTAGTSTWTPYPYISGLILNPWSVSVALDVNDNPHLSWMGTGNRIMYAQWDGSAWIIYSSNYVGSYNIGGIDPDYINVLCRLNSLVIGPSNYPHFAYFGSDSIIYGTPDFVDVGIRVYHQGQRRAIMAIPDYTNYGHVRIYKNGVIYGLPLVSLTSPWKSPTRIQANGSTMCFVNKELEVGQP